MKHERLLIFVISLIILCPDAASYLKDTIVFHFCFSYHLLNNFIKTYTFLIPCFFHKLLAWFINQNYIVFVLFSFTFKITLMS